MKCDCCNDTITKSTYSDEISYFRKKLIEKSEGSELCNHCLTSIMHIKYSPVVTRTRQILKASSTCVTPPLTEEEMDSISDERTENETIHSMGYEFEDDMKHRIHKQLTIDCLDGITLPDEALYEELAYRKLLKKLKDFDSAEVRYDHMENKLITRRYALRYAGIIESEYNLINDLIAVFDKHSEYTKGG